MTIKDCNKTHRTIIKMRKQLKYNLRKTELKNRIKRIHKRCSYVKSSLRVKRNSCKKNRKCIEKSNGKIRKFIRLCKRKVRRSYRSLRVILRRHKKFLRNERRNKRMLKRRNNELVRTKKKD